MVCNNNVDEGSMMDDDGGVLLAMSNGRKAFLAVVVSCNESRKSLFSHYITSLLSRIFHFNDGQHLEQPKFSVSFKVEVVECDSSGDELLMLHEKHK